MPSRPSRLVLVAAAAVFAVVDRAEATFVISPIPADRTVVTAVASNYAPQGSGNQPGPGSKRTTTTIDLPVADIDDSGTSTAPNGTGGTAAITAAFDGTLNDDKTNYSATMSFTGTSSTPATAGNSNGGLYDTTEFKVGIRFTVQEPTAIAWSFDVQRSNVDTPDGEAKDAVGLFRFGHPEDEISAFQASTVLEPGQYVFGVNFRTFTQFNTLGIENRATDTISITGTLEIDATSSLPHLPDPKAGKVAGGCANALAKTSTKLIAGTQKSLDGCASAVLACVETKNGDDECLEKANAKCTKLRAKIDAAKASLVDGVVKKCDGVAPADLVSEAGLGFADSTFVCQFFGEALSDAASVGRCLAAAHVCSGEALYGVEHPRAGALLRVAGLTAAPDSCLADRGGADESLGDPAAGKALGKCVKGIAKAGAAFTAARLKIVTKCANKVYGCVQTKPDDDGCIPKVKAACDKDLVKLGATPATLAAGLIKACGAVPFDAITGAAGLDAGDIQTFCAGYGGALGSLADYADCIARHHTCVVESTVSLGLPRTPELLNAVGQALFSDFCAS